MIEFANVHKSYPPQDLLVGASLRINPGERIGLVGANGAGKTTVFQLITGEILPDKGEISTPGNRRISYLRQQLPDDAGEEELVGYVADALPELASLASEIQRVESLLKGLPKDESERDVRELGRLQSRFESLGGYDMRIRAKRILGGLGFQEKRFGDRMSAFSGGWQMRASLARVLVAEPEIMLLDEPSNYLDIPAVEWLQRHLRDFKGTLVLISHDRYLLNTLTSVTVEIAGGILTRYQGNYDYYVREREMRLESLWAARRNQDLERAKIERFAERFRAKNTKASQVRSRLRQLEKMEEIVIPVHRSSPEIRLPHPPRSGEEIVRLENASLSYDGGSSYVLEDVNLRIGKGEKIALVGYNGTGKTTLLKMLAGVLPLSSGNRVLGHNVIVGYQAQEFSEILPPEMPAFEVLRSAIDSGVASQRIRTVLGAFGFSGDDIYKKCGVLSGGEKIRLSFARIFVHPPNFLVLDEPTTHLDLQTRESLQVSLTAYDGTVCVVSHDIEFVRNLAGIIFAIEPPGVSRYCGDYAYYLEKSSGTFGASESDAEQKSAGDKIRDFRRERAQKLESAGRIRRRAAEEAQSLERHLHALEAEKLEIVAKIESNQPGIDFREVNRRLTEIEKETGRIFEMWMLAASRHEELSKEYEAILREKASLR